MLDRFGPINRRTRRAAAGAVLAAVLTAVAADPSAAAATSPSAASSSPSAAAATSPSAASSSPSAPAASPTAIGGAQLACRGVIVSYPSSGSVPRLPNVKASAWVIADADTGQVLAAKDPHGWYRPASTLKVLTAVALIPVLNPDATVVATKQATSVTPNVVGLLPGHPTRSPTCSPRC